MSDTRTRRFNCPGSGRRTQPSGSSAFPEVPCPEPGCHYEARPVSRYGEHFVRAHRMVKRAVA